MWFVEVIVSGFVSELCFDEQFGLGRKFLWFCIFNDLLVGINVEGRFEYNFVLVGFFCWIGSEVGCF